MSHITLSFHFHPLCPNDVPHCVWDRVSQASALTKHTLHRRVLKDFVSDSSIFLTFHLGNCQCTIFSEKLANTLQIQLQGQANCLWQDDVFISAVVSVCDVCHPLSIKPLCCSCTVSCYDVCCRATRRKFCSLLWPLSFQKCIILYNVFCLLGYPTALSYCAWLHL